MSAGFDRKRQGYGLRGTFKGSCSNRKVFPAICAEVWHVGPNDYRVVILGIGEHSKHHQFNPAIVKAQWLGSLTQENLNHEISRVQDANDAAARAGGAA